MACVVLSSVSCFLPAKMVELSESGQCPGTTKYPHIYVDGYFSIDPDKGVTTDAGYEAIYPYAKFAFSGERGARSKFQAALVLTNQGNNGPERANRTEFPASSTPSEWPIYDNRGRGIILHDHVRITGFMIDDCVLKVEKIEKL